MHYCKSNAHRRIDSNSCSINYCVSRRLAAPNQMSFDCNNIGANILTKYFKHPIIFRTSRTARNISLNISIEPVANENLAKDNYEYEFSADLGSSTIKINQSKEYFTIDETIVKVSIEIKSAFQKSVSEKESFTEQNHQCADFGLNRKLPLVLNIIYHSNYFIIEQYQKPK